MGRGMLPVTVVIAGVSYAAVGELADQREPFDPNGGGKKIEQTFTGAIPKAQLKVAPVPNQTRIVIGGKTYIVKSVSGHNSSDTDWEFTAARKVLPSDL